MRIILLIVFCWLCLGASEVNAQYTGKLLFEMLLEEDRVYRGGKDIDQLMVGLGHGYIVGLVEGLKLSSIICIPKTVETEQIRKAVFQFLLDHPVNHDADAVDLVILATAEKGWICPNRMKQ